MKKYATTLAALVLSGSSLAQAAAPTAKHCLFGNHLLDTARYRDLVAGKEHTYKIDSSLDASMLRKIKLAMGYEANADVSLDDLGGSNNEVWVRTLTYYPNNPALEIKGHTYEMILSDPGENISGAIFLGEKVLAVVGDGSINSCSVEFNPSHNRVFTSQPPALTPSQRKENGNYFGDSLAELERIGQFDISPRTPDAISRNRRYIHDAVTGAAYHAAYVLSDSFTNTSYYLDVRYGKGRIVTKSAPHFTVAKIENGRIIEVNADLNDYDKLPWYYTN